ncbi:hypothetical protein D9M71_828490 [compost metagenome]
MNLYVSRINLVFCEYVIGLSVLSVSSCSSGKPWVDGFTLGILMAPLERSILKLGMAWVVLDGMIFAACVR